MLRRIQSRQLWGYGYFHKIGPLWSWGNKEIICLDKLYFFLFYTQTEALSFINVINGVPLNLLSSNNSRNGICTVRPRGLSVLTGSAILPYIKLTSGSPCKPAVIEASGDSAVRKKESQTEGPGWWDQYRDEAEMPMGRHQRAGGMLLPLCVRLMEQL